MNQTNWLIAFADRFAIELLVLSWQALVLVAFVWLSLKLAKLYSPVVRHQVWLFCLISLAVLPLLTPLAQRLSIARPANTRLNYVVEAPRAVIELAPNITEVRTRNITLATTEPSSIARILPFALPLLSIVWFLGFVTALVRLIANQIKLEKIRNRAQPVTLANLNLQAELCEIDLRLSDEVDSPLLHGVFRPVIILPSDISEWTTVAERKAMIQHELAHIERRDNFTNFFQTSLRIILFFHPLLRYACRQLSLERELACDEYVVARGAGPEVYAEGLLKVAERRLLPGAEHQLAFFSTKRTLERRIDMILNFDRLRAGARHWKLLSLFVGLIAIVTWLLIPIGGIKSTQAQLTEETKGKLRLVKKLANDKAFDELIEMALRNPDADLRRLAVIRLTELEGDGSTSAMVQVYNQTQDLRFKSILIDALARNSEVEPLIQIALSEPSRDLRLMALRRIKFLKENSESDDVKALDVTQLEDQLRQVPAEPPPPPAPPSPLDMTVTDNSLSPLHGHKSGESVFTLLRELAYASVRHDAAFFEKVLTDDYIGTLADGTSRNKAQEIAEATRQDRQITKVEFEEFNVTEEGNKSIANVAGTIYTTVNGQEIESEVRYEVHVFKANGQMKITAIDRLP